MVSPVKVKDRGVSCRMCRCVTSLSHSLWTDIGLGDPSNCRQTSAMRCALVLPFWIGQARQPLDVEVGMYLLPSARPTYAVDENG